MQASIVELGLYRVILYIRILYQENNQTNVKYLKPTPSPAAIPRSAVPPGGQGQGQGRTRSDGGAQSGQSGRVIQTGRNAPRPVFKSRGIME